MISELQNTHMPDIAKTMSHRELEQEDLLSDWEIFSLSQQPEGKMHEEDSDWICFKKINDGYHLVSSRMLKDHILRSFNNEIQSNDILNELRM